MPKALEAQYMFWEVTVFRFACLYLDVAKKIAAGQQLPRAALALVVRGLNRIFPDILVQNPDELVLVTPGSYLQSKRIPLLDEHISVPSPACADVTTLTDDIGGFCV